jgi:hypothetical protein
MGRKIRVLLFVLLGLIFAGLVLLVVFAREIDPVYQGKRLSEWTTNLVTWQGPISPEAMALQRFGSNATPMLVKMLHARDSSLEMKVAQFLATQKVVHLNLKYHPASVSQKAALTACGALGEEVHGAVPDISALIRDYPSRVKSPQIAICAVHVLAAMGPDGIPALCEASSHPDTNISLLATRLLGTAPFTGTPDALKTLQAAADGSDATKRPIASQALQTLRQRQQQKIPPAATHWDATSPTPVALPVSVWDVSSGVRVNANSGLFSGYVASDVFGSRKSNGGTGETGTIVFRDGMPDGYVHSLEWETPAAVTLRSFGVIGFHQAADEVFERAFRTFRLYARTDANSPYQLIWTEEVPVPYGQGHFSTMRYIFRNFDAPVTGSQFRAEFVQNGTGPWFGPRVIAMYGFTNSLNVPMATAALSNRDPYTQKEARGLFEQWARGSK